MVHVSHFLSVFLTKEMVWDNMNTMNKIGEGGGDILLRRALPFNVEKNNAVHFTSKHYGKIYEEKGQRLVTVKSQGLNFLLMVCSCTGQ